MDKLDMYHYNSLSKYVKEAERKNRYLEAALEDKETKVKAYKRYLEEYDVTAGMERKKLEEVLQFAYMSGFMAALDMDNNLESHELWERDKKNFESDIEELTIGRFYE
jgi:hypothetical protein